MLDGDSWILYFEPFISASRRATQPCRNVIHFVKISFEFSPDTFQNTRGLHYSEEVARSLGRFGRTSRKVLCGNVIESSDRYHCPLFYLVLDPLNRLISIENCALSQGCFYSQLCSSFCLHVFFSSDVDASLWKERRARR